MNITATATATATETVPRWVFDAVIAVLDEIATSAEAAGLAPLEAYDAEGEEVPLGSQYAAATGALRGRMSGISCKARAVSQVYGKWACDQGIV